MLRAFSAGAAVLAAALMACGITMPAAAPAAGGDLLVAPTRVVIEGRRGAEVVLNNIGAEPATYRVSLELRHMTAEGRLEDVAEPTATEKAALEMVAYAPRRVTLQPNQPQSIRIGVRAPEGLPDGEYRVHMLFRAIPDARPVTAQAAASTDGLAVSLTPIYGVTIPVIVRRGALTAEATISNAHIATLDGRPAVAFDLVRSGNRSLYGEVRVLKPGAAEPVILARGIAVYPEIDRRSVVLPVAEGYAGSLAGPATIQYVERPEDGGRLLAEARLVLR